MKKVKSVLSCKCQLNGEEKIAKHAGWCILQMAFCRNIGGTSSILPCLGAQGSLWKREETK